MGRSPLLLAAVAALVLLIGASASSQKYKRGDQVPLYANKVKIAIHKQGSDWTQRINYDPSLSGRSDLSPTLVNSMSITLYPSARRERKNARASISEKSLRAIE